jgi:hypothetical protein
MTRKICVKCGERKNKKSFSKHIRFKDGMDSRCKKCIKKETKIRNKLHKTAPEKPLCCPVCKKFPEEFKTPHKWHLDHDPDLKYLRGWLCQSCNLASGNLGDNMQSVANLLSYMFNAKRAYLDNILYS